MLLLRAQKAHDASENSVEQVQDVARRVSTGEATPQSPASFCCLTGDGGHAGLWLRAQVYLALCVFQVLSLSPTLALRG